VEERINVQVAREGRSSHESGSEREHANVLEQLRWCIEHLHHLTVHADAKAAFIMTALAALVAGALAAHAEVGNVLMRGEGPWACVAKAAWVLFVLPLAFTMVAAFLAVWPRTYVIRHRADRVPMFHADVAKKYWSPSQARGDLWVQDLHRDWGGQLENELATNAVTMSQIIGVKMRWTHRAMVGLACMAAIWLIAIFCTFAAKAPGQVDEATGHSTAVEVSRG
jgi:hypothetical protein